MSSSDLSKLCTEPTKIGHIFSKHSVVKIKIVTLYLISTNVYNSVDAPRARGFSYIEIWMIGAQIPILLALCEYGFVLCLKKVLKNSDDDLNTMTNQNESIIILDDKIKKLDFQVRDDS